MRIDLQDLLAHLVRLIGFVPIGAYLRCRAQRAFVATLEA
jgi:hypothetical protein